MYWHCAIEARGYLHIPGLHAIHEVDHVGRNSWKDIRILPGCENSVPMVTVWHHKAFSSDAKQLSPRDRIFYLHRTLMFDSFSCIPLDFQCFILEVSFVTIYNDADVGHFDIIVTSQWCQPNDKVTWHSTQQMHIKFMWRFSFLSYPWVILHG